MCHVTAVPVGGLGGDERPQRRECRVDRIGAISFPSVGRGPLASLPHGRRHRRAVYPRHGSYINPCAQLPLPVHLDVKGGRRGGGQAVGRRIGGVGGAFFGARARAAILIIVFREEGNVAVQETAGRRCRAQHGKCHLGWQLLVNPCWTSASSAWVSVLLSEVSLQIAQLWRWTRRIWRSLYGADLTSGSPGLFALSLLLFAKTHLKCHLFSELILCRKANGTSCWSQVSVGLSSDLLCSPRSLYLTVLLPSGTCSFLLALVSLIFTSPSVCLFAPRVPAVWVFPSASGLIAGGKGRRTLLLLPLSTDGPSAAV